jgi:hypothetical protein
MPTPQEFLDFVREMPEVRVLETCARRCGLRFGIRGGIVRSLVFSFSPHSQNASVYDFVDAFSDIDVVVERESDWPLLEQAIISSLPFAGFHRWEVATHDEVQERAKSYVLFPLDRLILWIEPKAPPLIRLEGVLSDLESALGAPSVDPDLSSELGSPEDLIERLLTFLRFVRYYSQYPAHRREYTPDSMWRQFDISARIGEHQRTLSNLDLRRIELAILHALFNCTNLRETQTSLSLILQVLPERWHEASQVIRTLAQQRFADAPLIGAAVYLPKSSSHVRTRLDTHRAGPFPGMAGGPSSIIPWTRLSVTNEGDGCCRYRDFRLGPAVIAWRGQQFQALTTEEPQAFGTVIQERSAHGYKGGTARSGAVMPIPGFIQNGNSLVLRFDHAYVGSMASRNLQFYVGLVRTIVPEGHRQ